MQAHMENDHKIDYSPIPRTTFENDEEIAQRKGDLSNSGQAEMLNMAALATAARGGTKRVRQPPARYSDYVQDDDDECE